MHEVCIFCKIVAGELPGWRVHEDEEHIVILDKYPQSYGHMLVMPKKHYRNMIEAPPEVVERSVRLAREMASLAMSRLGASGVRIVINTGRSAGQVIHHLHVHVIPFYEGERRGGVVPGTELTEELARELLGKLRD